MLSRRRALSLALPALGLFASSCALLPQHRTSAMGQLMVERLSWMDEVAAVKQAKHLPITDAPREAELLKAMEQKGAAAGIPTQAIRGFFIGQMSAAKTYQTEWLKDHPAAASQDLPDLGKTVRPALDQISTRMITTLAALRSAGQDSQDSSLREAREALKQAGYSQNVITSAITGLEAGLDSSLP